MQFCVPVGSVAHHNLKYAGGKEGTRRHSLFSTSEKISNSDSSVSDHSANNVVMVTKLIICCSGPSAKASEEDQERTRRLADAEMHRHHLESLLDQRDREITALREVTPREMVMMVLWSGL